MVVRNFHVKGRADGHQTATSLSPRAKDGGFELTVLMREKGSISDRCSLRVEGIARDDGTLLLRAISPQGILTEMVTER